MCDNSIIIIKIIMRGKIVRRHGLELPNGEIMKEIVQEGYKYLGINVKVGTPQNDAKEEQLCLITVKYNIN